MDIRLQVFEMHRHLFQNKDVLDIGCNVGHISIAVARTLGARSVMGMDIDPILISEYSSFRFQHCLLFLKLSNINDSHQSPV